MPSTTRPAERTTVRESDRCDSCGAQAYTAWTKKRVAPLRFCGHHTAEHEVGLVCAGWALAADERARLLI